jgi:hypothetical protein
VATKPLAVDVELVESLPPPPHEAIDSAPSSATAERKMDAEQRLEASVFDRANAHRIGTPSMPCAGQAVQRDWRGDLEGNGGADHDPCAPAAVAAGRRRRGELTASISGLTGAMNLRRRAAHIQDRNQEIVRCARPWHAPTYQESPG